MIKCLLVANRGEIAVRVIRAARDLGVETVTVYSEVDAGARHVELADRAVCIGPAAAGSSYLRRDLLLHVATSTGCDAVHPGYGFLAEDERFASQVVAAGLVFVGPEPETIGRMGDKAVARAVAEKAGAPVLPGSEGVLESVSDAQEAARRCGFPVLLKARSGGGGKGMRLVGEADALPGEFRTAAREAQSAFGDAGLYVEKLLLRARHIEVQVLADADGTVVHFGERDCSMQRRHQKVLEEAPSPGLAEDVRGEMCAAAVRIATEAGYLGAGTVEFLLDMDTGSFYFIEMNTRIQVEHPVTEELHGVDLVAWQLRIAGGETVDTTGAAPRGHSVEFRINAEDPACGFVPGPGRLTRFEPPSGPGIRVDTHCATGAVVPPHYDSLIAKLVVTGACRREALRRARRALAEFRVEGVPTTIPLHRWLLDQPEVIDGSYPTDYLDTVDLSLEGS
jgi:acetyl-CoA carboxylase biotin carboxylase subunit